MRRRSPRSCRASASANTRRWSSRISTSPPPISSRARLRWEARGRRERRAGAGRPGNDGEHAWLRDPQGAVHEADVNRLRDFETSFRRDTISMLLAAANGTIRARILPDVKDDAGKLYNALELSGNGLEPVVLSIDPQSGLIAKQTFVAGGPGGQLLEERFSAYRGVDGIQVPFTTTAFGSGRQLGERQVTSITFNA